jgi:hypothetical protein
MLRRLMPIVLVSCLGAVRGQTPPTFTGISQQDFNTFAFYHTLFAEVTIWQQLAAKEKAEGKDNRGAAHAVKNQAGLTDAEEATLTAVASSSINALEAHRQSVIAVAGQFRKQNPAATQYPPALAQQLQALKDQDLQTIFGAVQQLQAAFGQARFQNLEHYVRTTVSKNVSTGPPMVHYGTPPPLPAPAPAPGKQ